MIQEEVRKFAPSKRAAAFNTINKVWENEMDRSVHQGEGYKLGRLGR